MNGYPPKPDYGDYSYRKDILLVIDVVLVGISSIVVLLRFYTRCQISRYFGPDDWWMLLAWLLGLANTGLWIYYLELGSWKHVTDIPFEDFPEMFKVLWMIQWVYLIATGAGKMSVLAFYLRVFQGQSRRFRHIIFALMALVVVSSATMAFVLIFQCDPVHSFWSRMFGGGKRECLNPDVLLYTSSGIIVVTDVTVFILPMKHLWRLSIPNRQKLQVMFLMGLGGLTCVASAFRVYYLSVLVSSQDRNYDGFEYSYWTSIELFVGIITTCLPPCKPFFMRLCCAGRTRSDHFTDELGSQSYARTRSTTVPSLRFSNEDDRSTPTSSRDQYHEFHFHKTRSLSPVRMEDR
ncbi:hypothetical protein GLAREA_02158 [Glarea lozoyensis ATCC 20868]|uniref:Rhodopsin domain-containing protein n=1 Tax=Glarea lozoyensis (strain ATCC 20868 / MF5171) TaxID=1116229 RepID=S3D2I4_GLAL2|nr:uncharacterized protein GLAREA_02158 [Glarea lozoyensis ATCC 20868]EPE26246.1 hypothetical protein GLAREA_02158 [Glarea lozoyensis ATCC 20868]